MTRRSAGGAGLRRLVAFGAVVAAVAAPLSTTLRVPGVVAAEGALLLVDAPLTIAPDGRLVLDVRAASGATLPTAMEVSVRAIDAVPGTLAAVLDDTTTPSTDTVQVSGSALGTERSSGSVGAQDVPVVQGLEGVVRLEVPTETIETAVERLSMPEPGTYAVTVRAGALGSLTVPVIRRSVGVPAPEVPLGVVVDVDAPLSLQPDGSTSIVTSGRATMNRLVAFLEASTTPVSVSVRPELLDSLERSSKLSDRDLVKRLAAAVGPHRLLSVPYLHIDPSIAANAGASADFTAQLRLGEDALNRLLGRLPDRRVWLAAEALSPAGAELVRNLGAQVIVEAGGAARDLAAAAPAAGNTLSPVLVPVEVDDELALGSNDPVRAAHRIALELLLAETGRTGLSNTSSSVVLQPDLSTANPDVLDALMAIVADDDSLRGVDMVRAGSGVVQTVAESAPLVADFSAARTRRAKLNTLVIATSAIVPTSDPRRTEWAIRADVLLDTRLADDERAAYETQLRADLLAVQNNVVLLMAKTINLSDRDANIPVTLENRNDVAVSVRVRLVSSKLRVPPTSEVVTLEPGATATLRLSVTARSNGRFPVRAQMLAPGTTTVVGKTAVINVRVGRLTGLGIVFTFAAALALLSWWVQHLRRRLRREETKELQRRQLAGLPVDDFDDVIVVEDDNP